MKAYGLIIQAFAWVAALILGVMALAVTFDVVARNLGWGNTGWVVELSEYSLPVATLLVAPYLLQRNEHVRLDVLLVSLPRRGMLFLEPCAGLPGMLICAIVGWDGARLARASA